VVKRLASALAGGCVLALGVVVAPALSLSTYRPEPVDFELAPPPGALAASSGRLVSRPLRAPKRFNLVGLRWRGRSEPTIAVRVRKAGERWSRWASLPAHTEDGPDPGSREERGVGRSSPAWVGDADELQYRLGRPVTGLRLHFVNVKGTATAADRVRTALRRTVNAAVASLGRLGGADAARAQGPQPAIVPRSGWGAEDCPPRREPRYGEVKAAFVHHTVNLNDYTPEEAPQIVLAICRYHRNNNGWDDIGYNFLVDKYGTTYEGRAGGVDRAVVGAQAQGYNMQTTGIANIGTFTSVPQSEPALQAMARLIRWKLPIHGAPTAGTTTLESAGGSSNRYSSGTIVTVRRVIGHRDTNRTACPGDALYAQLTELRGLVGDTGGAGTPTWLGATPSATTVAFGTRLRVSGRLRRAFGGGLRGRSIEVQVLRDGRWVTVRRAVTGSSGRYSVVLRMAVNRLTRASFGGAASLLASTSKPLLLAVRPLISVSAPPVRASRGMPISIRGSVRPSKPLLYLVVERRRSTRFARLAVKPVRVRGQSFKTSFKPGAAGLYRFYLLSKRDAVTARARSRAYGVSVVRPAGGAVAAR
jgi:hypothetical protein